MGSSRLLFIHAAILETAGRLLFCQQNFNDNLMTKETSHGRIEEMFVIEENCTWNIEE